MDNEGEFNVRDFEQNEPRNAYILSALGSLGSRVQKVIVTKEVNFACIYRLKFFVNGLRKSIIVDDYVPVVRKTQIPAFCSSLESQSVAVFWAILVEKAWAKLNGSYSKIRNGTQSFLCIHLTGVPAENIRHAICKVYKNDQWGSAPEAEQYCWQRLLGAYNRNYKLIADARPALFTDSPPGLDEEHMQGIKAFNNYVITQVLSLDSSGTLVRILRLQNRDSEDEWTGLYSRQCPIWSEKQN